MILCHNYLSIIFTWHWFSRLIHDASYMYICPIRHSIHTLLSSPTVAARPWTSTHCPKQMHWITFLPPPGVSIHSISSAFNIMQIFWVNLMNWDIDSMDALRFALVLGSLSISVFITYLGLFFNELPMQISPNFSLFKIIFSLFLLKNLISLPSFQKSLILGQLSALLKYLQLFHLARSKL